jgi:phage gp46-like protein
MDIALLFDANTLLADLGISGGGLTMDPGLDTAVIISLFTDRRAEPDDPIDPLSPTGDLRGWAGDLLAEPGDRIGSRLWLLRRAKMTDETISLVKAYAEEALQWLVDDGVATQVVCTATRVGLEAIELVNEVYRGAQPLGRWKFAWTAQQAKGN